MRPVRQTINQNAANPATGAPVVLDQYLTPFNVTLSCEVVGSPTYTVEWTTDDVFSPTFDPSTATWFPGESNLVAATDSQVGSLVSPVSAVRCRVTAGTLGTDEVKFTVQQAGIQ